MMFADDTGPTNAFNRIRRLHVLFAVAALGALGSSLLMAHLAPNGYTTRAYYGTDTRAQALLVGAAIALGLQVWHEAATKKNIARFGAVLAIVGVLGAAYLWTHVNEATTFAFSGGFLLASLAAGAVVLGVVLAPWGPVVKALEVWPLAALGRISYGVYLWYWPVLLVMSGQRIHWSVYPLFVARGRRTCARTSDCGHGSTLTPRLDAGGQRDQHDAADKRDHGRIENVRARIGLEDGGLPACRRSILTSVS